MALKDFPDAIRLNPQQTGGFLVQWNKQTQHGPRITIPCDPSVMATTPKFIEVNAIMVGNGDNQAVVVRSQMTSIIDKKFSFSSIRLITIQRPLTMKSKSVDANKSILSTIRVPIS